MLRFRCLSIHEAEIIMTGKPQNFKFITAVLCFKELGRRRRRGKEQEERRKLKVNTRRKATKREGERRRQKEGRRRG